MAEQQFALGSLFLEVADHKKVVHPQQIGMRNVDKQAAHHKAEVNDLLFVLADLENSTANIRVPPRRLDQLLANLGYCSRREARDWLDANRVTLNGQAADDPGQKADPTTVRVDNEPLDHPQGLLLLLNKPLGLVCSHEEREGPNVYSLLPERWRRRNPQVTSIGRLDKDTSGLLLLTDQTELVHRLTSPKHKVQKIYHATVAGTLKPEMIPLFASGTLVLAGEKEPCLPAALRILDSTTAEVVLTEGRYHQVRRMFASQGCEVVSLHRSRFGDLELGDLPPGQWRELPLDYF
ncbi:MAG: pseudouridine synthase [Nibricoccus sp.]